MATDMKRHTRTIIAAPQVADMTRLRDSWRKLYLGTDEDFYAFMTTPSAARSLFLASQTATTDTQNNILLKKY